VDSIQHITNLTGGDTRDGYDTHAIRTRVDRGSEFSLRATHHWGSKDIGIKHTRLIHWLGQGGQYRDVSTMVWEWKCPILLFTAGINQFDQLIVP